MQNNHNNNIAYRQELLRKGIHLLSLSIPIIYAGIDKELALWLLLPVTAVAFLLDVGRRIVPGIAQLMHKYFGKMMRPHEVEEDRFILNGATYVLLSACLCVLIFPKMIAIVSFSVLIIADIASALYGRKFGKTPFLDKSLEGTTAFWISAFAVVVFIGLASAATWQFFLAGTIASLIGGVAEAASIRLKMDDNFSIPMSVGFSMWGLLWLMGQAGTGGVSGNLG